MATSKGQIFIGGTGRCGTTILSKILGKHNQIYRLKHESRFIIDPGGIIDLIPALSDDYSPYNASNKIKKFKYIMDNLGKKEKINEKVYRYLLKHIFNTTSKSYLSLPLGEVIGDNYDIIVKSFFDDIIDKKFKGSWIGIDSFERDPKIISSKKFSREEIQYKCQVFIDNLFKEPITRKNKNIWLDHTPFNILHSKLLVSLFPDAKIIHIYRDIRDVISSYKKQSWGGENAEDIILWQKNVLDKWLELKNELDDYNYFEIRLEDLIKNPEKKLREITEFIGVDFDDNMLEINLTKGHSGRWKKDLDAKEIKIIKEELLDIMNKYGYEW